ncbi:DUF4365 domain-containing protein [Streptomyces sp. NPDC059980]|uniref:DUF4365 domain-containing protein n=1 Tax=Streptomyces sp. NPDC059980 TaxID=3347022 RepID=UPI0036CEF3A2
MRPTHLTDRFGVSLVSLQVVSELGWLFREQETSDVGIDAQLEVVRGASMSPGTSGKSTGRLLAVQIKSGPSQFAGATDGGWWYPCDAAHVEYWTSHSLPVVVLLVDTGTHSVYWQHVNPTTLRSTGKHFKIFVPAEQRLDAANADALAAPARFEQGADPVAEAADRLPAETRLRLLKAHRAGRAHAAPLALLLADSDPAFAVRVLLTSPLPWLTKVDTADLEDVWRTTASYAGSHELGMSMVTVLERAAAVSASSRGRLLALAALAAAYQGSPRAASLAEQAGEEGDTLLLAVVRAVIDSPQQMPEHVPDVVQQALVAGDPAATADANVLRFTALCHVTAGRHDEGEAVLERALRLTPGDPDIQAELARCLLYRNAVGAPRQAFLDIGRAMRLASAARAEYRRWRGPSVRAARVLLDARVMAGDITAAIGTVLAEPEGDAQGSETSSQELLVEAVRVASQAGQSEQAATLAESVTGEGDRLQLLAHACDAAATSSREARIAAWEAAAAGASSEDQRAMAAYALAGLGVWPVPHLERLHAEGALAEAPYQTRWATADAARGDDAAAVRRLRRWESRSVVAAAGLVLQYDNQGEHALAAEAAERAGRRFGDTALRSLAVDLRERAGDREGARIAALTLLTRPLLPDRMRGRLRRALVQWAGERGDWSDMEDHALAGLAEEAGIDHVTAAEGAGRALPYSAMDFAWAAIHAQVRNSNLETARDTLTRFAPQVRNEQDARAWLTMTRWSGWTPTLAETALDLAERFQPTDTELSGRLTGAVLAATGEQRQHSGEVDGSTPAPEGETRHALKLPELLRERLERLLTELPPSAALTPVRGGAHGLARRLEQTLGRREVLLEATARGVRAGQLPVGMLAAAAQQPVTLTLLQRAAGVFPAGSTDPAHTAAERKAAHEALGRTAVVDVTAFALTTLLPGRLDEMRAAFASTPSPTAVCDDVLSSCYSLRETERSTGVLGVRGGQPFIAEYSNQDRQEIRRLVAALSPAVPGLQPVEVPDLTQVRRRLNLSGPTDNSDDAWLSAAQFALDTGAPLWCDDAFLRNLLIAGGIPTFGSIALLDVLTDHDDYPEFTANRLDEDLRVLLTSQVVDLPVTVTLLAETAASDGWKAGPAAAPFSSPNLWETADGLPLWTAAAEQVWTHAPGELADWLRVAANGATVRAQPSHLLPAVLLLSIETLLAVGLGPEPAREVERAALDALRTAVQAVERLHEMTGQPVPGLPNPTDQEFRGLLRAGLQRALTGRNFSASLASTIVDEAVPPQT